MANTNKILIVNLQDPSKTKYCNPKTVGVDMMGRRLSNYILFVVSPKKNIEQIKLRSTNSVNDIQNCVSRAIEQDLDKSSLHDYLNKSIPGVT